MTNFDTSLHNVRFLDSSSSEPITFGPVGVLVRSLIDSNLMRDAFNEPLDTDFSDAAAIAALDQTKLAFDRAIDGVRRWDGSDWVDVGNLLQRSITGTQGQRVGFDASGNPIAEDATAADVKRLSMAELKALPASQFDGLIFVTGERFGMFEIITDTSTNVTAALALDPLEGVNVALTNSDGTQYARRIHESGKVNARWFGALSSTTGTVNAAAIQGAIEFVAPTTAVFLANQIEFAAGTVQVNSGVYSLDTDVVTVPMGVRLQGQSQGSTLFNLSGSGIGIRVGDGSQNIYAAQLEDFSIRGDGTSFTSYNATPGQIGIQSNRAIRLCYMRNITVWTCDINIEITGFAQFLDNCYSMGARSSVISIIDGTQIEIRGGRYEYCPNPILNIGTAAVGGAVNTVGFTARQAAFQNGEVGAIHASGGIVHLNIEECFFEGNNNGGGTAPDINISNPFTFGTAVIRANRFTVTGGAKTGGAPIDIENLGVCEITGNHVFDGNSGAEYEHLVIQRGDTESLRIAGNRVSFDGNDGTLVDQQGEIDNLFIEDQDGSRFGGRLITDAGRQKTVVETSGNATGLYALNFTRDNIEILICETEDNPMEIRLGDDAHWVGRVVDFVRQTGAGPSAGNNLRIRFGGTLPINGVVNGLIESATASGYRCIGTSVGWVVHEL